MRHRRRNEGSDRRQGSMAVTMAIGLVVSLFVGAIAVDVGYMLMVKTQMQAAADAAALAGGTELLPGLGKNATKTPQQIAAAATPVAVQFAAANRAGDMPSAYLDAQRDVNFGKAVFDRTAGQWQRSWGATPYNMIGATVHRDQAASTAGDQPLPLFFARAMGRQTQDAIAHATAVILPARGFMLDDDDDRSNLMPFAYRETYWRRLEAAQEWYNAHGFIPSFANDPQWWNGSASVPMFYSQAIDNQGDPVFDKKTGEPVYEQDVFDNFSWDESAETISGTTNHAAPDGWLEVNVYPRDFHNLTAGNAATIDLGETDNAASELSRQIIEGLSALDFAAMELQGLLDANGALIADPTADPPITLDVEGDTGLSISIKAALEAILGRPKAISLFSEVVKDGNNAVFTLVEFVGIRVMDVDLVSTDKEVWVQMAPFDDGTAVPDYDSEVGPDTTFFTPLILID